MADSSSNARGIDPSVAVGMPPDIDASDEDKGRYVVARYAAQNDHYVGIFKTWTKTLNFLSGEQWRTKWDGTSLSWGIERDVPEWRQQPVTNYTYAVYRTAIAKLTKQKPTLEVVPPSGNSEDKEAAELAHALLTYLWRLLKKPAKLPPLIGWVLATGVGYIRVGYDPHGGQSKPRTVPMPRARQPLGAPDAPPLPEMSGQMGDDAGLPAPGTPMPPTADDGSALDHTEEVEVACDEDGEAYRLPDGSIDYNRKPDLERTGEIDWSIVSPLCVRLNPEATSHEDATEMYVANLWPKNKAAAYFGIPEDELGPGDESSEQRQLYEDLISGTAAGFPRSWTDQTSHFGVSQQNAIGPRTLVIEYYAKQSDDFLEGRHWITAGTTKVWPPTTAAQQKRATKKVVTDSVDDGDDGDDAPLFPNGEAPLPFGFWPPLIPLADTPVPGQPLPVAVLSQVVPLNEQLNMLDGKISEHHTMMSMGGVWFICPEDKGMVITSEPAQVIVSVAMGRRGAAYAPFQAQMKALPDAVYREREVVNNKIQVISGMSGPDLSQKPEGVPSGRALLVTQETSDSVLMPLLFSIEAALEESGRRELVIAQEKYREARIIAVRQTDGKYIYRSFRNADLRDGHDVRVEVGSSFPWSKSAQLDSKMQFLQAVPGIFTNMQTGEVDVTKLAQLMDSGAPGLAMMESDENPDLIEIEREHAMFEVFDPSTPDGSHQLPQIAFWQNSPVHLKEHYTFMKKSWTRFQKWHPAAKKAFETHMMLTMAAVEQAASGLVGAPAGADAAAPPPPGGESAAPTIQPAAPGAAPAPASASLQLVKPGAPPPGAMLTRADRASANH